jgi:hypothetical protein
MQYTSTNQHSLGIKNEIYLSRLCVLREWRAAIHAILANMMHLHVSNPFNPRVILAILRIVAIVAYGLIEACVVPDAVVSEPEQWDEIHGPKDYRLGWGIY